MSKEDGTLGDFIKSKRQEAGWSLRKLAELSGVSTSHLSRIENGERSPTTEDVLARIANALGVDIEELRVMRIDADSLPSTRAYFRRKLGVDAAEADVLANLIEFYQEKRKEARDENTNQD